MILLRWLHTIYAIVLFTITFLLFFPVFIVCAQNPRWHMFAYKVTQFWGRVYFILVGIRVKIVDRNITSWERPCIYVANHFSFSDIATLPLIANDACFVGKQSISKVPLFGYFFRSLHITVDRASMRDRAQVFEKSIAALNEGKSLIIFPEGGIRTTNPPLQTPYKDGAFRMAIAQKVPIVPVTLPLNWKLLPDDGKMLLRGRHLDVIIHPAIETIGLKESDIQHLKERVFQIIQGELDQRNSTNHD